MKLATFHQPESRPDQPGATFAAVVLETAPEDPQRAVRVAPLGGFRDVGEFLAVSQDPAADARRVAEAAAADPSQTLDVAGLRYATPVPFPGKVFAIGLNYVNHIEETGQERPEHPTVFTKFAQTLTGPEDEVAVPEEDHRLDYEGELCVVIGRPGRRIAEEDAAAHIAGYAVANDVSLRGWQGRTSEWTQGKVWEASTPVGPWVVTADEFDAEAEVITRVNGEVRQQDRVADVVFSPEQLVSYLSTMVTLLPGDLIMTGTPEGVALARKGPDGRRPWLKAGDVVEVEVTGLGRQTTRIV